MFDRHDEELRQRLEEEEQRGREPREPMPRDDDNVPQDVPDDDREARLQAMQARNSKWDTKGLKPNTMRKKIGIALLIAGLVGFLIIQYVLK